MFLALLLLTFVAVLLALAGVGRYVNFNTQQGPAVDRAYVDGLVTSRHSDNSVELFFRSNTPTNRHQNFIIFHLSEKQYALWRAGKLQPIANFNTDFDQSYGIFAQSYGGIRKWVSYVDAQYLVLAVPSRYVAFIDYYLRWYRPTEAKERLDASNYYLQSVD